MRLRKTRLFLAMAASLPVGIQTAMAQDDGIEEIITIGSRNIRPRSAADSPAPVDVISSDEISSLGNNADLTDALKAFVPSFTATPATGDGSAFVRPTSLRGMAPDQTLVLVNGKRRHRSALVHFFAPAAGNGAHGVDIGMIPGIALQNIEVLRDGASSQYGSDAIAGVINFQLKDAAEGGEVQVQYGEYYDGESSEKIAANFGFAPLDDSFVNVSLEHIDNQALSRGLQRPDAQALIDAGNAGVGVDTPFGDSPLVQSWGRPETSGTRFAVNAGYEFDAQTSLYLQSNYADTQGRYRFFYRNPTHPSLNALANDSSYSGALLATGYTPFLDGDQKDFSIVSGFKGLTGDNIYFDYSIGYGSNELDYFLNNTTNPSLGLGADGEPAQRDFGVGSYRQEEINFNADFSLALSNTMNLGTGLEWREETYSTRAGEPNSYLGAGSNGFTGASPAQAGNFSRDNIAVYADIEHDLSESVFMQYAIRYEDFSDFGSTLNGKIASLYRLNGATTLRASISSGFHAPTPGQSNVRTTLTTFDGTTGLQQDERLVPPTSAIAISYGGTQLKEEESTNFTLGFTSDIGAVSTLTVDLFRISVKDRIYRTGDIALPGTIDSISFYTNSLDVDSEGLDIVLTSEHEWSNSINTSISLAATYNKIDVGNISTVGGITPVSASTIEDIENNYPNERFILSTNTLIGNNWNLMVRANYYGDHYDERGSIGATVDPSAEIDAIVYFDAELGWDVNDNLRLVLGGSNVFDEFIDTIGPPNANRLSVGLQYPRRSAANYEGGSWYMRAAYRF